MSDEQHVPQPDDVEIVEFTLAPATSNDSMNLFLEIYFCAMRSGIGMGLRTAMPEASSPDVVDAAERIMTQIEGDPLRVERAREHVLHHLTDAAPRFVRSAL